MKRVLLLMLILVATALPRHALADEQRSAAAQHAFDEAKALVDRGQHAAACRKLESSLALEEALGARFALAECYERIGKLGSAWRSYVRVADDAAAKGAMDKEGYARKRADELRPRVPTVTLQVADGARALPNLALRRDDETLSPALIGTPIPMDPGTHQFTLSADGHAPVTSEVTVTNQNGGVIVTLPMLVPVSGRTPSPGGDSAPTAEPGISPLAIIGLVAAGVGIVGMGVGVGVAASASGDYDDAVAAHCDGGRCTPEGLSLTEDARSLGTTATIVFAVGGGLAAVGLGLSIYGFAAGGEDTVATILPVPGGGVLQLQGAF